MQTLIEMIPMDMEQGSCILSMGKRVKNTYDFDVKKADKIFDLLLEKKQLRFPTNHVIPSSEELKGKKY